MDMLIPDMGNEVKGECSVPGHEGKTEVLSYSHGVAMPINGDSSAPERTLGKPNLGAGL